MFHKLFLVSSQLYSITKIYTHFLFLFFLQSKVSAVVLSAFAVVFVSLGIFWTIHLHSTNRPLLNSTSHHSWKKVSSSSYPKYCSICRQLISGFWIFRNFGYECKVCGRASHMSCRRSADGCVCKCISVESPLMHVYVEGNLMPDSLCVACGVGCSSAFGLHGLKCLWCQRTIHGECKSKAVETCDLGILAPMIVDPTAVSLIKKTTKASKSPHYFDGSALRNVHNAFTSGLREISGAITRHIYKEIDTSVTPSMGSLMGSSRGGGPNKRFFRHRHSSVPQEDVKVLKNGRCVSRSKSYVSENINKNAKSLIECYWIIHINKLLPDSKPLLVFVNQRSGGQQGKNLIGELSGLLNPIQVVNLTAEKGPLNGLLRFKSLKNKLSILVCGGDGSLGWVMDAMYTVFGANHHIPVGVIPLGTGNDLARVLGWKASFDGDVKTALQRVQNSHTSVLDRWDLNVSDSTGKSYINCSFNSYIDVGIAARISLRFHMFREKHPQLFKSQFGNKLMYGEVGVRDLLDFATVKLDKSKLWCDGAEIILPKGIEGIIVINIPSFAGGVCLWRQGRPREACNRKLERCRSWSGHLHKGAIMTPEEFEADFLSKTDLETLNDEDDEYHSRNESRSHDGFDSQSNINYNPKDQSDDDYHSEYSDMNNDNQALLATPLEFDEKRFSSPRSARLPPVKPSMHTVQGRMWHDQSIKDQIIEVVAVKSLFHLGQVQVGLATPIRICQGKEIVIRLAPEVPIQVDGEPQMLAPNSTVTIKHKHECFVLSPSETAVTKSLRAVNDVLEWATSEGIIGQNQKFILLRELSKCI
eukprot:GHVL01024443.1.p1 GENE.GHVL01024443.1~~GHVL01024443.1.p1  ORF type:complete len:813 (+),score=143.14 GHVL01024443.1:153-2591(+)